MDILFIDGNNLACKAAFTYDTKTADDVDTSVVYGFLAQFVAFRKVFRSYHPVVVWDGGYVDRTAMSEEGVRQGIIKEAYKENRTEAKKQPEFETMSEQLRMLQSLISSTNVPQVRLRGEEADDVIATYCRRHRGESHIICFTSDKDYFQLLHDNVCMISRRKGEEDIWTKDRFEGEYGISPPQWVDAGALSGDSSDNIFGVYGFGDKKAVDYVKKYGTVEDMLAEVGKRLEPLRAEYPDLQDDASLAELRGIEVGSKGQRPYDLVQNGDPYSGVALAAESGRVKKANKMDIRAALFARRIALAKRLKAMNTELAVPELVFRDKFDNDRFLAICDRLEFVEVPAHEEIFRNFP